MTVRKETGLDAHSMRKKGKSFWLASLILPRDIASNASRLYNFCRAMDDLADESVAASRVDALTAAVRDLQANTSNDPVLIDFLELAAKNNLPLEPAICLVETLIWDAGGAVRIETEQQLLRYCFGAAGTVGLLMCPLLKCRAEGATEYAVHLGIAMQLTNIARDVLEDARNGRRYLPAEWGCTYYPVDIAATRDPRIIDDISQHIDRLLSLADVYYASAARGFVLIPRASQGAIRVAAAVYREIGLRLRASGMKWGHGRTLVPTRQRLAIALRVWLGGRGVENCSNVSPSAPSREDRLVALPGTPA